jgi:hypothetical protein
MKIMTDRDVRAVEQFVDKVQAMRKAQKNWFRYRDSMMMLHARKMETEVDQQLEVWEMDRIREEARELHPELFSDE